MSFHFRTQVWKRGDKERGKELAFFYVDQMAIPPYHPPPTRPKNEIEVGRLFHGIQSHKRICILVEARYGHVIHMFLEAQQKHTLFDIKFTLFQPADETPVRPDGVRVARDIASLSLSQVQIEGLLPTEADTYTANLRVRGVTEEEDFDE
jgi:hypothetical protein